MNCIVCGSSFSARQKKCPGCGAELLISKADFLFEFDNADISVVKKHYEAHNKSQESADRRLEEAAWEQEQNSVSGSIIRNSDFVQHSVQNSTTEPAEAPEMRSSLYSDELSEETSDNSRTVYDPPLRPRRTVGQRIRDFFRNIVDFFRVILAIIGSVVLGVGSSLILLICINNVMEKEIGNIIFSVILLAIAIPLMIWLYRKEFEHLGDRGILYRWLSRELVITPIVLIIILVAGALCLRFVPALKYKVGEFQLNRGSYSSARATFEELGDYNDSIHMANTVLERFPSTIREGDIIKFGTYEQDNNYENGKEDIEWQVVYERSYDGYASYVTLISKNALEYKYFDTNYWENSSLRYWLNNDFLNAAFTPEQQNVLDFTGGYNTDKVDIFTIGNKEFFPIEILHTKPTEYARSLGGENINWCFRWTNRDLTFEHNTIQVSYVDSTGNILGDVPDGYFYIRPVIRLKIFAYENQLAYGDNFYTELYNSDLSGLVKTYTGTYVAGQGITCVDFTITSCDKYGNITAEVFFYPHPGNPTVSSGRYLAKGCITTINKKDGSFSINIVGDKWINRPADYEMLELSATVDSQFSSITGVYQFDVKAVPQ